MLNHNHTKVFKEIKNVKCEKDFVSFYAHTHSSLYLLIADLKGWLHMEISEIALKAQLNVSL